MLYVVTSANNYKINSRDSLFSVLSPSLEEPVPNHRTVVAERHHDHENYHAYHRPNDDVEDLVSDERVSVVFAGRGLIALKTRAVAEYCARNVEAS